MSNKSYSRIANAVKLHYLQYNESKKKEIATDYLKHLPSYLKVVPEYNSDSSMLFYDNENDKLIFAMRGLDFSSIKQQSPYVAAGGISGTEIGGAVGNLIGGTRGRNRFSATGKLIGAGIGSYLTANKEAKSAMEIIVGAQDLQVGEYNADLNKEIKKIRDIQVQFPDKEIVLAGHSRGGLKAIEISNMMDLPAYLFNPATEYTDVLLKQALPIALGDTINNELMQQFQTIPSEKIESVNENVLVYRTPSDLVSSKYSNKFNIELNNNIEETMLDSLIGKHSIDHFISQELLDSINEDRAINNEIEIKNEMLNNINIDPEPQSVSSVFNEFRSGTPNFQPVNPYYLCKENPTFVGCQPYL